MFQKILVPLDGSKRAAGIIPYVSQLARGLDVRLTLFVVVDPEAVEVPMRVAARRQETPSTGVHETGGPYTSQTFDMVEEGIKNRLRGLSQRLHADGVDAESKVVFGKTAEEIVRVAEHEGYGLIAMSTHARGAMGRSVLGGVTDKVVHSSSVPVLTIRPEEARKYRQRGAGISTVIAPLDGSILAEGALPYVEELARKLSLDIVLARAVDIGVFSVPIGHYEYISTIPLDEELEREASKYLGEQVERLREKGFNVTGKLLRGNAAKTLVDMARKTPQSIVAMTTRGRSGVTRWFMGSVTEKVVRSSGSPVLIITPQHAEQGQTSWVPPILR